MSRDYGGPANSVAPIDRHPKFSASAKDSTGEEGELFQGFDKELPKMPGELGQIAKKMWFDIGLKLQKAGVISSVDISVMRVYCETYEHYVLAQREIVAEGTEFQKTPNGYAQLSPAAVARERHAARLSKLESKLFLTPAARQAVKLQNPNQGSLGLGID